MELKEFIKTAITDITDAVSELQAGLDNGAIVNPSLPNPIPNETVDVSQNDSVNNRISNIDFDIALTVSDTDTIEGEGKIGIQVFSAKIGGDSKSRTENISRITFSIPIVLPTLHLKSDKEYYEQTCNRNLKTLKRLRKEIDDENAKGTTNS